MSAASVLGIPETEFTPRVRDAIMGLMSEVDSLRRELAADQGRLDEVEKTADQDGMLPLLNRRAFVRELTRYIAFTGRYNTPASLIYFDLNHLKKTNDTYGHAAGDAVLAHFADVLTGPCARQRLRRPAGRRRIRRAAVPCQPGPGAEESRRAGRGAGSLAHDLERQCHSGQLRLWRL